MPEIAELLERTTPRRPPAFDVADLARRGRRRRLRRQVGTGLGAVAVVAAAAGLGLVAPGDEGQVVASRPPTGELAEAFAAAAEPIGTWEQVADPPFSPRMGAFTGTTSDGRVVVWGGADAIEGEPWPLADGGIFDPEANTWEIIPPAPTPGVANFTMAQIQLAEDRLLVLGTPDDAGFAAAVYDLGAQTWTDVQAPPTIELPIDGVMWTGNSLVLAQLFRFDPVEGAFARVPVVERWSLASGEWKAGAEPPLAPRRGAAVAFDGSRIGVWGGSNDRLLDDGAIYDIAADRWEAMAPGPLPPTAAAAAVWLGGDLVVSGGQVPQGDMPSTGMVSGYPEDMPGLMLVPSTAGPAVYDADAKTWGALLEAPTTRYDTEMGVPYRVFDDPEKSFLAVEPRESGPLPIHVYDEVTRTWLEAPLPDLHTVDGTLIATSRTRGGPGNAPFEVQVLAGSVWEPATEAPFVNRMDAGVAVTGQDLLVVGGAEGPDLEITGDAWLLRFDARD